MGKYIIRLDDAATRMNRENWSRMEKLLDKYGVKPIVGVIPDIQDPDMQKYENDEFFWDKVREWEKKGWIIAMHGYQHIFHTDCGGINPVNQYSEFAGVPFNEQKRMISKSYGIFKEHNIKPLIFFAPAHTFDTETIEALRQETDIRIINDTIANDVYFEKDFFFIPQQSGRVRSLPFKVCTFCYHPNNMEDWDFDMLESFLQKKKRNFEDTAIMMLKQRVKSCGDEILSYIYFIRRR